MTGPLLTTARFALWQPQANDLADLAALTQDAETRRFLGGFVPSENDSFSRLYRNAGSWALHGYGTFMVRQHKETRIIATCGVFRSHRGFGAEQGLDNVAEAGWIVHRDYWGQGLAGEAMAAVLNWFDATHGRQRIAAMIEEGNVPSFRLADRLGFVRYGEQTAEDGKRLVLLERR